MHTKTEPSEIAATKYSCRRESKVTEREGNEKESRMVESGAEWKNRGESGERVGREWGEAEVEKEVIRKSNRKLNWREPCERVVRG